MFIYWQFLAVSLGESIFNADPETGGEAWDQAISWSGLENAAYNFVTMIVALFLVGWCQKIGAKRVHAVCLARPPSRWSGWPTSATSTWPSSPGSAWASPGRA